MTLLTRVYVGLKGLAVKTISPNLGYLMNFVVILSTKRRLSWSSMVGIIEGPLTGITWKP